MMHGQQNVKKKSLCHQHVWIFFSNGGYIDYLSFTYATSKGKNIKSYTIYTTFKKTGNIKNINTLKPFKINTKILMIRSRHEVVTKRKVSIPSFLSWPPSNAHTLSHWIMRYIVQDGFCLWFRGGCTACSRGRDEFHAVKMCSQAIMPNAQSKLCNCPSSWSIWYFG